MNVSRIILIGGLLAILGATSAGPAVGEHSAERLWRPGPRQPGDPGVCARARREKDLTPIARTRPRRRAGRCFGCERGCKRLERERLDRRAHWGRVAVAVHSCGHGGRHQRRRRNRAAAERTGKRRSAQHHRCPNSRRTRPKPSPACTQPPNGFQPGRAPTRSGSRVRSCCTSSLRSPHLRLRRCSRRDWHEQILRDGAASSSDAAHDPTISLATTTPRTWPVPPSPSRRRRRSHSRESFRAPRPGRKSSPGRPSRGRCSGCSRAPAGGC